MPRAVTRCDPKRNPRRWVPFEKSLVAVRSEFCHTAVSGIDQSPVFQLHGGADIECSNTIGTKGEPIATDAAETAPHLRAKHLAISHVDIHSQSLRQRSGQLWRG